MSEFKDFTLGISGFKFQDLYRPDRLKSLHEAYWKFADQVNPQLRAKFDSLGMGTLNKPQESEILIEGARVVGEFIAKLFQISNHAALLRSETLRDVPVFRLKKDFLNIRVFKRFDEPPVDPETFKELNQKVERIISHSSDPNQKDSELQTAEIVIFLVDLEKKIKTNTLSQVDEQKGQNLLIHIAGPTLSDKIQVALKTFEDWCVQVWVSEERRAKVQGWASYVRVNKTDYENLVLTEKSREDLNEAMQGPAHRLRPRDGFKLTDRRMGTRKLLRESDYCIICHQREKDSCSHGFQGRTGEYKKNPLGVELEGCPLDQRISEMHMLRRQGDVIASLAMIMIDNPLCAGTGHRICNECIKACIFQKQDPVDTPQSETGILIAVLNLPYGFEIYSLLTRFNPLNKKRPYALPYNGNDVLVVGLGPAGYTLAHYLSNEGFGVVGIDALKIEPLDPMFTGKGRAFPKPIQDLKEITEDLDERVLMGFGGVSEYGITVRWDKNFLTVIYLTLARRKNLSFYGGTRFGGTLNLEDIWSLGFKHVAIATGAGRPTIINMKNNLIRGIRKASDFLMGLQLSGAFKRQSMANLQVRLPAIVIGGGLTAFDTATELLAYYPIQVEKALERFEFLSREYGENNVWQMCDDEEKEILKKFIEHGRAVKEERELAKKEKRTPNFISMCRSWGGVTLAYRKRLHDSPGYRLNHEEVNKALQEGIGFIECVNPVEAHADKYGAVEAITFGRSNGEKVRLSAKSVMVAAGTSPNTIYEREYPGTFEMDDRKNYFRKYRANKTTEGKWELVEVAERAKDAFFLSYDNNERFVTFYGDNHPDFAGNVVKAMASAKLGAPQIAKLFWADILSAEKGEGADLGQFVRLVEFLDDALIPRVVKVDRLTPTIIEVTVKAHYAARKFEPGQFYRLQNFETLSHTIEKHKLAVEALALTGAWVDKEKDLLSLIVLEMGASSKLCALLEPGEPVVVMGPTGAPSEIPQNKNVLLVGGGLGNAVLLSISKAMKENGCKVIYFAGYRKPDDVFKQSEIEEVATQVIWSSDSGIIAARRPQDGQYTGNIVQAILAYAKGEIKTNPLVPLNTVEHLITIGSDRMMAAVAKARHDVLAPYLRKDHIAIASINSSMQCMMKEVCAQCLQRHIDPITKEETGFVFSCYNQDQNMDCVDFKNLNERLKTNSVAEKLTNLYVDYLLKVGKMDRI